MTTSHMGNQEQEPSGLDTVSNAAVTGDHASEPGTASVATTTKHPRHRPGCSCIVCIQPPSGKGKHKPTCTCNVCMTVKRRFKTLMMRKKKRQSEREAALVQRSQQRTWGGLKEEAEVDSNSKHISSSHNDPSENEGRSTSELESKSQSKVPETSKSGIDLNCHPDREEAQAGLNRMSMMRLLQVASLPLDTYLKQNGLTSLMSEQQASSASHVLPPQASVTAAESDGQPIEHASGAEEHESEENCEPEPEETTPSDAQ